MQIAPKQDPKSYEVIFSSPSTNMVEGYILKAPNLMESLKIFMRSNIPYKEIYEVKVCLNRETHVA